MAFEVEVCGASWSWVTFYEKWQGFRLAKGCTPSERWSIAMPFLLALAFAWGAMFVLALQKPYCSLVMTCLLYETCRCSIPFLHVSADIITITFIVYIFSDIKKNDSMFSKKWRGWTPCLTWMLFVRLQSTNMCHQ